MPDIDEDFARQFDEALREYGGPIRAALADYEIEAVPPDLHVLWEHLEMGVQYLRTLEREIDQWMGPYRRRWEREDGQRYADAINAPLSPATIEALAAALNSGDHPRYKVRRRADV